MAAMVFEEMKWSDGERKVQQLMKVPYMDNPTVPMLSGGASALLSRSPILAVGAVDPKDGKVWTTIWGSDPGFARGIPQYENTIALKVPVDNEYDPVVEALMGQNGMGQELKGKMVGALAIDLETRRRVKLFGRAIAGAMGQTEIQERETAELQLIINIEQTLGNCPKYLNSKHFTPAASIPSQESDGPNLSEDALNLLEEADLFFVSSASGERDMSTNHRGGPKGFLRAVKPKEEGESYKLVWPEYSGNRLYQTLGRFFDDPRAGLAIPNFETGDLLYVSGTVELLVAEKAAALLPRSNLAVCLTIQAARLVKQGLFVRAKSLEPSPYNPSVRKLASELSHQLPASEIEKYQSTVRLLNHKLITPTIARFTFTFSEDRPGNKALYSPGQWVALDFNDELSSGYSHMRDSDPTSLNDDLVRTFTVSSSPSIKQPASDFEITIRKVGRVTDFLFQAGKYKFKRIEAGIKGFGGDFKVDTSLGKSAFVAGGVGITPLMSAGPALDKGQIVLYWTLQARDYNLVSDFLTSSPQLATSTRVYFTSTTSLDASVKQEFDEAVKTMTEKGTQVYQRRLSKDDLQESSDLKHWYICTSAPLRTAVMSWLPDKEFHYEDFNF